MIPLHDDELGQNLPAVTLLIIAVNVLVFVGWQLRAGVDETVMAAGLIPAHLTRQGDVEAWLDFVTSMFLHGSWLHLISNMWFLWIFGNNVEDATGHLGFVIFYLLCGSIALLTYFASSPDSILPVVGASGAISGVLGAYLVMHPRATVSSLVLVGIFPRIFHVPAYGFLLYWIAIQFLSQAVFQAQPRAEGGGVAYLAHIGGFVAGVGLIFFFRQIPRREYVR